MGLYRLLGAIIRLNSLNSHCTGQQQETDSSHRMPQNAFAKRRKPM
jgi:hypothetical protein